MSKYFCHLAPVRKLSFDKLPLFGSVAAVEGGSCLHGVVSSFASGGGEFVGLADLKAGSRDF